MGGKPENQPSTEQLIQKARQERKQGKSPQGVRKTENRRDCDVRSGWSQWFLRSLESPLCLVVCPLDSGRGHYQSWPMLVSSGCHNRLGGLNNRNVFYHSFKGQKSEIKVSSELVGSEPSLLGLQMVVFSPCPHMIYPLCLCHNLFLQGQR